MTYVHKLLYPMLALGGLAYKTVQTTEFNCPHRLGCPEKTVNSWLFGTQDASPEYQRLAREALHAVGIENADSVQIKQMNALGSLIAQESLYSFTAHGIWLNEAALSKLEPHERTFTMYHEAAHYLHNHYSKTLLHIGLGALLICGVTPKVVSLLLAPGTDAAALVLFLMIGTAYGYFKTVVQPLTIHQEHEADYQAARILTLLNKRDVVEHYLSQLRANRNAQEGIWWETVSQQIATIEAAIKSVAGFVEDGGTLESVHAS